MTASANNPNQEQGFLSHLIELRDRLLRMVLAVGLWFIVLFPFSSTIYAWLADPLLQHLPEGSNMIAIDVASPFLIPFKLVLMLAVFLSVPIILYQLWAFIAPGLYTHEQRLVRPLLVSSSILFYLGVAFAYFVVFPLIFGFFTSVAPDGVEVSTDIGRYLSFVITIFFAFGIAFEVPIATILLVITGVTTPESLAEKRPYFIVAAFIVGMFLTPPDVISQTLLALPMWLLFELGIIFSKLFLKRKAEAAAAMEARYNSDEEVNVNDAATVVGNAVSGNEASGHEIIEEDQFEPLSEDELDAELDRIEESEMDDEPDERDEPESTSKDKDKKDS